LRVERPDERQVHVGSNARSDVTDALVSLGFAAQVAEEAVASATSRVDIHAPIAVLLRESLIELAPVGQP
jgi:Holliday junction resolvasome RuvABC DNA-binding subunit